MIPVYSLLAINMEQVEKALLLACAAILLVAFFVGFKRGFRQVGWKGILCLTSFELFVLLDGVLKEKGLILNGAEKLGISGEAITSLIVAGVSILLLTSVYALCWVSFRPKFKWVTKNPIYSENEFEYEDDAAEYETGEKQRRIVWKNAGTPTVFGRYIGGLVCAINIFSIMLFVACALLLILGNTLLAQKEMVWAFLNQGFIVKLYDYALVNGIDYIFICILVCISHKGYEKGFLASLFTFLSYLGTALALAVAFYVSFKPSIRENALFAGFFGIIDGLLAKIPVVGGMLAGNAQLLQTISNVCMGAILFVVLYLALALVKNLVRTSGKAVRKNLSMRRVDGVFATLVYFILGVLICLAVWCVLWAGLHVLGDKVFLDLSFMDNAKFVNAFYDLAEKLISPILIK